MKQIGFADSEPQSTDKRMIFSVVHELSSSVSEVVRSNKLSEPRKIHTTTEPNSRNRHQ